ncbi:MAG: MlaD family protein [Pyrinomonadaceae bacterium]
MPPIKKSIGLRELRVGILVLLSIAILIILLLNASGNFSPFSSKLRLKTYLTNADGLQPGAEVRLAGVRVGKVGKVDLRPPSDNPADPKVEVVMEIDAVITGRPATERIRTDSVARLGSPNLIGGEKVIDISSGSVLGRSVKDYDSLPSTETTPFSDLASSSTGLVEQLNKLSTQLTDISRKVNEGQGSLGRFVNDEAFYNNLNATIRNTQEVIDQIKSGNGSAGKLIRDPELYDNLNQSIKNLRSIVAGLEQGRGTAGKFVKDDALYNDVRSTIARLNQATDSIEKILGDVRSGRGTIGKLLTDEELYNDTRSTIKKLDTTATRIDEIIGRAQRGEGTIGKLLTDDQLYNNINQFSAEGVKMLYDFRQNPKKYLTIRFRIF